MDFPQTIELKARVQPLDTALFRYPFRVRVQGDKAVVMDLHGTDYFCHVFHYPGFRYLASFGKRGEAPEEMLSAENIRWHGQSTLANVEALAGSGETTIECCLALWGTCKGDIKAPYVCASR